MIISCPDHGNVRYQRVSKDDHLRTEGLCRWVMSSYEWKTYRENFHLMQMGTPVTDWWSGLAAVHAIPGQEKE